MSVPRRSRNDPVAMMENENSVRDVYNNLADIRDSELIKDWNDSLNFLLIFAAIFAAVLTALIVESMKLLQEDPQDTTNAILLYMSSQLANSTMSAYQSSQFQVPQYAIVVNSLLFTSLCCSLIAALAAVLALQWVNEYDARIDTIDSEKRAAIRHFRFVGVGTWKMAEIIAFLPLLLHSSVFLFFAGIVAWLRNVHLFISWICVTGTAITVMFYIITTILAATFGSSPFRSPMARVIRYVQFTAAWYVTDPPWLRYGRSIIRTLKGLNQRSPLDILRDARSMEAEQAKNDREKLKVLMWTINHIDMTTQSTHRLLQILKYAILYSGRKEQFLRFLEWDELEILHAWRNILNTISQTYIDKAAVQGFSSADLEAVRLLFSSRTTTFLEGRPSFNISFYLERMKWDGWPPILKLIGPISYDGILQTNQLELLMGIFNAMWLKDGEKAAQQLVETIQSVSPQDEQISSYSVDCLSIFLWTHGTGDAYRQAAIHLAEMIAVPPRSLFTKLKAAGTIELTLSAIYSVAFNYSSQDARRYWNSGHRLYLASELGDNSAVVQALHSAVTSRIASEVAQATNIDAADRSLRGLCRLMAYTPLETVCGANAARASGLLENMPIFRGRPYMANTPPALTSLVWLPKLNEIQRIHEYLEVILSCRQRFPSLKPVWRNWGTVNRQGFRVEFYDSRLKEEDVHWPDSRLKEEDVHWLDHLKSDRQIIEVFRAFDGLLEDVYSPKQHLVLVKLLIDDLDDDDNDNDNDVATSGNYYTDMRKASLRTLKDPVLRLIGARAGGIAYYGLVASLEANDQYNESWFEALRYWCGNYKDVDADLDEGFLVAMLSQPNTALHSVVLRSSSHNSTLRDKLRQVLESRLNEPYDTSATLLLHTVARTASWFPEYMTPANLAKVMEILRSHIPKTSHVLPFLAFLAPLLSTPDDLEVIMATTQTILLDRHSCLGQSEASEIYSAFGGLLQDPQWMEVPLCTNPDQWREALESMRGILDIIRIQEESARAVLRWNGRAYLVPAQGDEDLRIVSPVREVSPQEDGAGNQDHHGMWLERPYSCAASLDI